MNEVNPVFNQRPGRSTANRSLERGMEILRAFRPGSASLGNGEIAERTGLSRSTVSRLCNTLVGTGFLQLERASRSYRLAPPVLSLGHAMRSGSPVLQTAAPLMRATAERLRVNVGLATADRTEMVYLESVRFNRRPSLRTVVSGQRVPMELTSLGWAWLAAAPEPQRRKLMDLFRRRPNGKALVLQIEEAIDSVRSQGYCAASWQPEVVAMATPISIPDEPVYALNFSISTDAPLAQASREMSESLLEFAQDLRSALARR